MVALWGNLEQGTTIELSRLCGVSFGAAYSELKALKRAGLLKVTYQGAQTVYAANDGHENFGLLRELVGTVRARSRGAEVPSRSTTEDREQDVRIWLKEIGAPLLVEGKLQEPCPSLEEILAQALHLAHRDATITRILPVCLWLNREELSLDRLEVHARRLGETQALGFFLALTGELSRNEEFLKMGERFRDRRRKKAHAFFEEVGSKYNQALTERNTPEIAKRWCFHMNMGLESFQTAFERFAHGEELLPA